jgi:hypothetical protein
LLPKLKDTRDGTKTQGHFTHEPRAVTVTL